MQWHEIRQHYPHQWLLVEAITAHSAAGKRILEQLAVVDTFPDSVTAMKRYTQLHRDAPERELYNTKGCCAGDSRARRLLLPTGGALSPFPHEGGSVCVLSSACRVLPQGQRAWFARSTRPAGPG